MAKEEKSTLRKNWDDGVYISQRSIWKQEDLNIYEKMLWMCLEKYANGKGTAWPSRTTLSAECSMSLSQIKRTISSLIEKGLLSKETRKNDNNTFKSNLYTLFLPTDRNIYTGGRSPQNLPDGSPQNLPGRFPQNLGRSPQAPELNNNECTKKQQQEHPRKASANTSAKKDENAVVVVSSALQKEKKKAYYSLLSIGLTEKTAAKFVKENTPDRIYSCIDYAKKIGKNIPATCVAALNEEWNIKVKKATQNPTPENKVLKELKELETNTEDRWSGIEVIRQVKQALSNTSSKK